MTLQAAGAPVDFDKDVAPVLVSHCLDCHSGAEPKGGLRLDLKDPAIKGGESGAAIVAKDLDKSLLWQRVSENEMPPKEPLSDGEKDILRKWIEQGAAWGASPVDPFAVTTSKRGGRDWWSLQPLQDVKPPTVKRQASWIRNEIDAFILARLQDNGLSPAPLASPRALVRRLHFDLLGLPPNSDVVAAFVANPSEKAYESLVDKLLASPHYGERWARHWLDVVRFGESDGFERNNPRKTAWPYRDWVTNALNDDLPYDQFVRMQLIGDLLQGDAEGIAATGFWVAGVHNTVVGGSARMKKLARQDELEEVLANLGQTFVGLTINCARCHDHKFDPISQHEFYQLSSAISGLGYGERQAKSDRDAQRASELQKAVSAAYDELAAIDQQARQAILAARQQGQGKLPDPPRPFAQWDFEGSLQDSIGNLHAKAAQGAKVVDGALVVDGKSFAQTPPVGKDIAEKTLVAVVQLDDLGQRGGAAISIETTNGVVFDAIVYGEREAQQWMAGSNGFVRTDSFQAPQENDAVKKPVHIALVYKSDGTIVGYRNGVPYGRAIRQSGLQKYSGKDTEVIFGLRHKPPGGNRFLKAKIHMAALYDRALAPEEVEASAGDSTNYVPEQQIVQWLKPPVRAQRAELKSQISKLEKERDELNAKANRKLYALTPGGGTATHILLRGDPDKVGELVSPGAVAAVAGVDANFQLPPNAPEAERRRKLSAWITSSSNPLFARVMVNRLWHYHFGTGIVDTPNDLGFNGGRPSHPQLLEWLAVKFRDGGFRLKAMHRLMVMSSVYRQAAFPPKPKQGPNPRAVDANNRLLWRMTPRRLEAEAVRDAMLVVAGKLNREMGGPSFEDVSITPNNGTTYYEPIDVDGPAFFRRTLYRFNPRGGRSALLDTLDCPDPAAAAPRRAVTTTPLQALSLLNNAFVLRMADYTAKRIEGEVGDDVTAQIRRAWNLTVARAPTADEAQLSEQLVREHGLAALCRGLFNTNEFVLVE